MGRCLPFGTRRSEIYLNIAPGTVPLSYDELILRKKVYFILYCAVFRVS